MAAEKNEKDRLPILLQKWEGIRVGMLDGQVQDGVLRAGSGREEVGTVVGEVIWGGSLDGLKT